MAENFFIGIDGGASSCRARLRDMEGNLLGEGFGGPANIHLDLDLARESIRTASRAAIRAVTRGANLLRINCGVDRCLHSLARCPSRWQWRNRDTWHWIVRTSFCRWPAP